MEMYSFIWALLVLIITVLLCLKIYLKLSTGWCRSNVCLVGKTVIITGANSGIGYETAADMAKRGATVILACRNETKAIQAVENLIKQTDNKNISYKILDLCSLKSVREFATDINRTVKKLDILINNAGIAGGAEQSEKTADGFEKLMQANYFGHFLLTHLLLDLLKKSTPSRIINVASMIAIWSSLRDNLNDTSVRAHQIYGLSKLCNILFTIELDKRLKNTGVTTYALHPGVINAIEGAQTTIYCAVTKGIENHSGCLFSDCHKIDLYKSARDPNLPKQLWEKTEELLSLKKDN